MERRKPSLRLVTFSLWTSSALYVLSGLAMAVFFAFMAKEEKDGAIAFIILGFASLGACLGMAVFAGVVAWQLGERKFWAWICALILGGLYVPSLFIVLGVLVLLGALRRDVVAWFCDSAAAREPDGSGEAPPAS